MADKVPLRLSTAFGPSREQALLLAFLPGESHDKSGKPTSNRRTLVLSLKGDTATFQEERPVALMRAWYSSGSGVGYCTGVETNKIFKWQAGKWSEETFADKAEKGMRSIFGLPGATPEEDELFMVSPEALFVRSKGAWTRHSLKKQEGSYQVHGRDPAEVFIGGDPLVKWNGKSLEEVGAPEDGEIVSSVWATTDGRLVGGSTGMYLTDDKGDWIALEVPAGNYADLTELDGVLFAAADLGLVQVRPPKAAPVETTRLLRLANIGDAVVGIGKEESIVGDGKNWKRLKVPLCEPGKRPE